MPELLSDADVFGSAPKLISDADAGLTDSYWKAPRFEPEKATGFPDLVRHPIASIDALTRRAKAVAADAYQHGTLAGNASLLAADQAVASLQGQDRLAQLKDDERALRPRSAKTALEQVVDFGAGLVGSAPSPESWFDAPIKGLEIAGRPIVSHILRRGASAGLASAATDPAVQVMNIGRGMQDQYSFGQTALAGLTGATLGAGFGAVGATRDAVRNASRSFEETPTLMNGGDVPGWVPKSHTPLTTKDLWQRLVTQESGDDQEATSSKGARGRAQLMPDTAREVAEQLGQPKLAEIALGNGPQAAVANEYLGQVYLNQQMKEFGDPVAALAAYNAGPGAVKKWIKTYGMPADVGAERWLAMIPYDETRNYVHAIMGDNLAQPHTLTPGDMAYMRGRMPEFPGDREVDLEPLADARRAQEKAADLRGEPAGIPWDDEPVAPRPVQETVAPETIAPEAVAPDQAPDLGTPVEAPRDLTDEALDQIRSGKKLSLGEGPTLIEALVKAGGLKDEGGELTNILGGAGDNRLMKMLRRVNKGMTLDEAAQWAQERGYIGDAIGAQDGPVAERATIQQLLDAIEREARGEKVYAAGNVNERARMIQEHMQDLDELLTHLDLDPAKSTNAEIRQAIDAWFRKAEEDDARETLGMGGSTAPGSANSQAIKAALAAARRAQIRSDIMATTKGGFVGQRYPTAVAASAVPNPPAKVRGVPEIVNRLANALGYPVRQGRINMRNAAGTYNRRTGIVRSKGRYDLNVLAHEFGHALEFTDGHGLPSVVAAMKAHTQTLKAMDYNQYMPGPNGQLPPGRRYEGFAEWLRWYITNPAYADSRPGARAFRMDFEAALAKDDPKALAAIKEAQADYQAWLDAPSHMAVREHVVEPPKKGMVASLMRLGAEKGPIGALKHIADEAYTGLVDGLHPWQRAVQYALDVREGRTGVRQELPVIADPYKILRSVPSIAAAGHIDLTKGVHGYHSLDIDSPAFSEALELALGEKFFDWDEDLIRDFGTYLAGRRVVKLYDQVGNVWRDENGRMRGLDQPPDTLSKEAWQQAVTDFEEQHPQWEEAAQLLYQWNDALWKKRRDAGLISDADYVAGLEDHPDYVPLFRDISDKEFGGDVGGSRAGGTKTAGGTVRLRGSDRAYINPLHSMMNMAYELNTQIAINDALKALDDIGLAFGPDVGRVVERIPAKELKGVNTSVDEVIENVAKQFGVSRRDAQVVTDSVKEAFGADDEALGTTIWRAKDTAERGEPIAYVWREGERIPLRLPDGKWGKQMVESLAGATRPMRNLIVDMASIPAIAQRAGIVAHPAFFLANSFRDQMMAFVLTDVGYRPFVDQARGLGHEIESMVGEDDLTRIYNMAAGPVGGYATAAAHEAAAKRDLNALKHNGRSVKHFASWNGFAHFTEMSETGTRLGIFERAFKQAKDAGMEDYAAAKEAAFAARDYMDFDRRGGWDTMRVLARITPFLNASVQALDKAARVGSGVVYVKDIVGPLFGGAPATAEARRKFEHATKMWITASALAVGGLALRVSQKDDTELEELNMQTRGTHWVVRLPSGEYATIPKPYELAVLSNIMERAFEATAMKDPSAWGHLMENLGDNFVPAHDSALISPIYNLARNRDNLGSPIVPDYLEGRLPKDQYTDRTSSISKWVGGLPIWGEQGVSPAKIDYLIKAWGGSNARDVLDAATGKAPISDNASDTYIVKRFVKDWTRGAISTKAFYNLVSNTDGEWTQAANSVRSLVSDGKYDEAVSRIQKMSGAERGYVMASVFSGGDHHKDERDAGEFMKQDHPLFRAQAAASVYSSLARDLAEGNVRGPNLQPIEISPRERRDAIEALRQMAVAEQRNAMIMSGVKEYAGRKPLPQEAYALQFQQKAPNVVPALQARCALAGVQALPLTVQNWSAKRAEWEQPQDPTVLIGMMQAKRFPATRKGAPTSAAIERAVSDVVPAEK